MSLAERCEPQFSKAVQRRGDDYYMSDLVHIEEVTRGFLRVHVHGKSGVYPVQLDWRGSAEGTFSASCSCPHFAEGNLCKHIWATIREAEYQELAPARLARNGRVAILSRPWPSENASQHDSRRSPWFRILESIQAADDSRNGSWENGRSQLRQVWYVIDVGASTREEELVINLFHQETKRSGELGRIKKLSIDEEDIDGFTRAEDRELLQMLLGQNKAAEENARFGYYSRPRVRQVRLTSMLQTILVPRLCDTARCAWLLDDDQPIDDARRLSWDDGPPWQFELKIVSDQERQHWKIRGALQRGEQVVSLADPVMVLAEGIVLLHDPRQGVDTLSRLDVGRNAAWLSALRSAGEISVPFEERTTFLVKLCAITDLQDLQLPGDLDVKQEHVPPRPKLVVLPPSGFGRSPELYAQVGFFYGDQFFSVADSSRAACDQDATRVIHRDPAAESREIAKLWSLGVRPLAPSSQFTDPSKHVRFAAKQLAEIVSNLVAQGWQVEADGRLMRRAGGHKLAVKSNVDWFELSGQFDFDGVSASLPELLQALKKGEKFVVLGDGTHGMLPVDWLARYGALADLAEVDGDVLRFSNSQAALLDALLASQPNVEIDKRFAQFRDKLRAFDGVKAKRPRASFEGELREYQQEGLGWLHFLQDFRLGGCLADDMGLGKTIQVLALLDARRVRRLPADAQRPPSLVVVPRSLVFNWIEEAKRFTPKLRVVNYTGLERQQTLTEQAEYDCLVTTYGTLRRDIVSLKDIHFDYAILDEAQAIKNASSQAAKACRLIQADHRLVMTGTPVENHLDDLWSLFEFLNPGMLGRSSAFQNLSRTWKNDQSSVSLLGQALRPFVLRRTKEQVLADLPEKTEQTLFCEMPREQRKLYDDLRDYYRESLAKRVKQSGIQKSKIHVLEALLRLRQAACHPGLLDDRRTLEPSAKLDVLLEQVSEIVEEGHKALIFSQFTSLLAIVRTHLDSQGVTYEYLDGRTRKRQEKVHRFQTDPRCPLFLISLKAGGYGLNLTAADYVFMLDPWWNPAVESQAIDRTHRIGQTRPVFAYRLICRDTVEEKILQLQQNKRQLADAIISANNNLIRELTAEDLQLLLG